ncbi:hypothetical protein CDAR_8821 [Caerostris darwini]|uniref:Secreted protein n=1 Tax=Caerostris darwini TaxID=1538125 RepID=A0AAV4R553_9ARAC|nr:hypothetical protein CDAR_8821 [Caerostris darwini]
MTKKILFIIRRISHLISIFQFFYTLSSLSTSRIHYAFFSNPIYSRDTHYSQHPPKNFHIFLTLFGQEKYGKNIARDTLCLQALSHQPLEGGICLHRDDSTCSAVMRGRFPYRKTGANSEEYNMPFDRSIPPRSQVH